MDSTATSIITKIAADQVFINEITIGGFLLSLLGLAFVIWQIRRTRQVAEAARSVAIDTRKAMHQSVFLADITACVGLIEEVKTHIREKNFQAALIRITDLRSQLGQLRHISGNGGESTVIPFQEILSQLFLIYDDLEQKAQDPAHIVKPARINRTLTQIGDQLTDWIGRGKYR